MADASTLSYRTKVPKILYYDIETSDLKADWGELLMIGYKWAGDKDARVKTICDFPGWENRSVDLRDKPLVEFFRSLIEQADVIVGHYSTRFDLRFINTRALIHGLNPMPVVPHVDTWKAARNNLAIGGNGMANIADTLRCDEQKGKVDKRTWRKARAHEKPAINKIAAYCKQDVRTQEAITKKLLPFCKEMPNMQLLMPSEERICPRCGSTHVHLHGQRISKSVIYDRYYCRGCGWTGRGTENRTVNKPTLVSIP